jgi:F5/8 type C domain
MMRRLFLFAVLVLAGAAAGCRKQAAPPAVANASGQPASRPHEGSERGNLLQLTNGAVVADRTGELSFNVAAIFAIDGNLDTFWSTPPNDITQSVTVALGTKSRITNVGFSNEPSEFRSRLLKTLAFESSVDGVTFKPLGKVTSSAGGNGSLLDVPPTEAAFLRATIVSAFSPQSTGVDVASLQARGQELAPAPAPHFEGCWAINQGLGVFGQSGGHLYGRTELSGTVMELDGGIGRRMARFAWVRDREFGVGALTSSPDGRHLNALLWHEEPISIFFDQPWYGLRLDGSSGANLPSKTSCRPEPGGAVFQFILTRAGRFPLFGVLTDATGAVDATASSETLSALARFLAENRSHRFQLVAHEFHGSDAATNRRISGRTIETLRAALAGPLHGDFANIQFAAAGSDAPRQPVTNDLERALYSVVDLVAVGTKPAH